MENNNTANSSCGRNKRFDYNNEKIGSKSFTVIITALISVFVTLMVIYYVNGGVVFVKYSQYGNLSDVYPISEVVSTINNSAYEYGDKLPTSEEMCVTAMKAIVNSMNDRYARYFTAEEYSDYSKSVNGSFTGFGIRVFIPDENGALVEEVYSGSPADKAGMKSGDIITAVDGVSVKGMSNENFIAMLGGKEGDVRKLTLLRGENELTVTVTIGEVIIETVSYKTLDNNIGYIYISQFGLNTGDEFKKAIEELSDTDSLIIDLRENPGGYLTTVVSIADDILDSGRIVSIGNTLEDKNLEIFDAKKGGINKKLAILINENSASASEILAAAIKENNAGTLVGMTTYGKGIVQSTGKLRSTDGYIKLTTAAYYTPNGNNIHGCGVTPDVEIALDSEYKGILPTTLDLENDTQLQKAIEILKQG